MAGQIRLFEKISGLLSEVDPAMAEAVRGKRSYSRMAFEADVLFTEEEETAREIDASEAAQRKAAALAEQDRQAATLASAKAKLAALGLTNDEAGALLAR